MIPYFPANWLPLLAHEFEKPYATALFEAVANEYSQFPDQIFPPAEELFSAFRYCNPNDLKVVIVGQDPYPTKGYAHGMSFSVAESTKKIPKSLNNIFTELHLDLHGDFPENGNLQRWAFQGVLLLNSVLTVKENLPNSHAHLGWEQFTDAVLKAINSSHNHLVFMFWGNAAQRKIKFVNTNRHLVLCAPHPSPLSAYRGFFGCQHFSKANEYLRSNQLSPVAW
jgi:uracil-DNA glycosylase